MLCLANMHKNSKLDNQILLYEISDNDTGSQGFTLEGSLTFQVVKELTHVVQLLQSLVRMRQQQTKVVRLIQITSR